MSVEALAETIESLPKRSKQALLRRFEYDIQEMAEKHVFHFEIKFSKHREPNAETRKSMKETQHWLQLKHNHARLQTAESKRKLEAYEKKIGIVRYENLEELFKDLGI